MQSHLTLLATCALAFAAAGAASLAAQDRSLTADFPEVYRVGGLDAPDWAQFASRGPAGFDGAGNLYILDRGAFQVVVIDPEGELIRTIGGVGAGPGEFGFPRQMVVWRDGSLAVNDLERHAIHLFGPGGEFDHSVTLGTHPGVLAIRPDPDGYAIYAQGLSAKLSEVDDALDELTESESSREEAGGRRLRHRSIRPHDPCHRHRSRPAGVACTAQTSRGDFRERRSGIVVKRLPEELR